MIYLNFRTHVKINKMRKQVDDLVLIRTSLIAMITLFNARYTLTGLCQASAILEYNNDYSYVLFNRYLKTNVPFRAKVNMFFKRMIGNFQRRYWYKPFKYAPRQRWLNRHLIKVERKIAALEIAIINLQV